jgi:hypothetical protein
MHVFRNAFIRVATSHSARFEAAMTNHADAKESWHVQFFSFGYYFYDYFH